MFYFFKGGVASEIVMQRQWFDRDVVVVERGRVRALFVCMKH